MTRFGVVCTSLALVLGPLACRPATAGTTMQEPDVLEVTLRPDEPRQTIHGFGASDAWSLQFVGRDWPMAKRERIADLLFSRDVGDDGSPIGIGLSIWRFNFGAGSAAQGQQSGIRDEWRRAESFLLPDGSYDWSKLEGQRWFLRAARDRGVDEFVGFVNSPPVTLTRNGRAYSSGGNAANLAPARYGDFARYLRDVVRHLDRAEGVHLDYLSPVNEPQWDWDGGQEGSPWLNREISALAREIDAVLDSAGLDTRIEIAEAGKLNYLYEDADRPGRGDQAEAFFDPESPLYIGDLPHVARTVTGHSYFTTDPGALVDVRSRLQARLAAIDPELEFGMTEYCVLANNDEIHGGGRDLGMNTALYVARVIHTDLAVANATSWSWWLAVSPYDFKDGLIYVDRNTRDGEIYASKLLWALGNYARFVRPGMQRIEVDRSDGQARPTRDGVLVSAFRHPTDGRTVVILVNQKDTDARVRVAGGEVIAWRLYRTSAEPGDDLRLVGTRESAREVVLPARSISTLVSGP